MLGNGTVCDGSWRTALICWIPMWRSPFGTYLPDTDVEIAIQVNLDGICRIGQGHLTHNADGFHLTGADGKLDYKQSAIFSHTLYSDYYWYEIGDVIGIGDNEFSYFCFPKDNVSVTKARLAAEELYNMKKPKRRSIRAIGES